MSEPKVFEFQTEFVETMSETKENGVLYISDRFKLAIHLCVCGCGYEVVTPFGSPSGWQLSREGDQITLSPSIGNFQFPCKSHYFIRSNKVEWC